MQVTDQDEISRSSRAGNQKYGMPLDSPTGTEPVFAMRPRKAFAWMNGLASATRWEFD